MADSDDEYDRKRRDKFRGERGTGNSEGSYRSSDKHRDDRNRGREDWSDRHRRDYRGGNSRNDRVYSPGSRGGEGSGGPPPKRLRGDWEEGRRYPGVMHDSYGSYGWSHQDHYSGYLSHGRPMHAMVNMDNPSSSATMASGMETQPMLMSFKTFLAEQDDAITDDDAIKKYGDYKQEYRRQQINEFFVTHKDEEWFKIKYHPDESLKRKEEQLRSLKNRLEVFQNLYNSGMIDSITVDVSQADNILKLLDTVVILLEGGTEKDLKVLDQDSNDDKDCEIKEESCSVKASEPDEQDQEKEQETPAEIIADVKLVPENGVEDSKFVDANKDEDSNDNTDELKNVNIKTQSGDKEEVPSIKRERSYSSESSDSKSKGSSSDSVDQINSTPEQAVDQNNSTQDEISQEKSDENKEEGEESRGDAKESATNKTSDIVDYANNEIKDKVDDIQETITTSPMPLSEKKQELKPRAELHRTTSIFLRNLAPSITKHEVEAMCKRHPGFLRVAIADPLQERKWFRRGWLTFQREVNIKDICWNLNNIRLRECELGAIVNRDLSRRVRAVNGICGHKQVVRADIKLCARIAHNLDEMAGLWLDENEEKKIDKEKQEMSFGLQSRNPVLLNITDYLIEEASAEEEELLGLNKGDMDDNTQNPNGTGSIGSASSVDGETIERDPQLTKVLDRLIMYLRIVHSVDFYNHCEYPYEDEMPNRCGILHTRGPAPTNKVTQNEINEYIRVFEGKMKIFLTRNEIIKEDELIKLGAKDSEAEVEKFVLANTQELAKDKWLCPLSGKKFKGPDFIRKHILTKHTEKVDEVRKEVEYYNAYLRDPRRPELPDHPGNREPPRRYGGTDGPMHHNPYMMGVFGGYGGFGGRSRHPDFGRHYRGGYRGRGGGSDFRSVIHYRDLDAPREMDDFA